LVDANDAFDLILPTGWHLMVPGDPAWTAIYGTNTSVEDQVKDGTIQDFVLPLDTPDARLMSLAIYVRANTVGATLETLADDYAVVLTEVVLNGYGPGTVIDRQALELPAGAAVRLESTVPYTGPSAKPSPGLTTRDDHVVAYVAQHAGQAYYLVFRGNLQIFGGHSDEIACVAASLHFAAPAPTASFGP
jgi:hypothetical protein